MKIFGRIEKVEEQDDGTIKVHGVASTEARDDQNEIVTADAMRAAIPDYMRFPALREMHQLLAAGRTLEAEVGDDKVTRIVAHVVDPVAVSKVKNKVYGGFSIGGNVTKRATHDNKTITGLNLTEISLVDRPANPEAILEVWKATQMTEPFNAPFQMWACGVLEHRHIAKADAMKCIEKRAASPVPAIEVNWDAALASLEKSGEASVSNDDAGALGHRDAADKGASMEAGPEITEREHEFSTMTAEDLAAKVAAELAAIEKGDVATPEEDADKVTKDPPPKDAPNALQPKPGDPKDKEQVADVEDDEDPKESGADGDKPYGDVKYADPGYQSDGKKRYPIDTEKHVRAAWSYINMPKNSKKYTGEQVANIKAKIKSAGKKLGIEFDEGKAIQAGMRKALWDTGQVACIIMELDHLQEMLVNESAMEGDDSPQPARLHEIITELCGFLNAMVAEETAEVIEGNEIEGPMGDDDDDGYLGGADVARARAIAGLRKAAARGVKGADKMAEMLKGARHSRENQAKLNLAAFSVGKTMEEGNPTDGERVHLGEAHKALFDAGALSHQSTDRTPTQSDTEAGDGPQGGTEHSTQDTGRNTRNGAPQGHGPASPRPGGDKLTASDPATIMLDVMLKAAGATHGFHLAVAHKAISDVSGGATCKAMKAADGTIDLAKMAADPEILEAAKLAKMSGADMAHLHKAHFHLTSVPGSMKCDAAAVELTSGVGGVVPTGETGDADQGDVGGPGADKAAEPTDLVKALAAAIKSVMPKPVEKSAPVVEKSVEKPAIVEKAAGLDEAALVKALGPMAATLEALSKRVDDIARTPIPAQLMSTEVSLPAGLMEISKAQDGRLRADNVDPSQLSPEQVALALSKMSKEEQTLTMIKASYANPLTPLRRGGVNGTIVP